MSKEKERLNPGFSIPTAMKTVSPNTKPLITPEIKKRIEFGAEIMKKYRARYLDEHRIEASWTDVDVALEEGAKLPEYAHPEDAGADIFARGVCLPSDNKMTVEEQDRIIEVIRACFE